MIEENYKLPTDTIGKKNTQIYEKLIKSVLNNDLSGVDYLEFREQLLLMQDLDVDLDSEKFEEFIFKATYKVVQGLDKKISKQILLDSIKHYITVIKNQEIGFKTEFENEIKEKISSEYNKINTLSEEKENILKEIEKLNNRLTSIDEEKTQISEHISTEKKRYSQIQADFDITILELIEKLESDKLKINKHIN